MFGTVIMKRVICRSVFMIPIVKMLGDDRIYHQLSQYVEGYLMQMYFIML